MNFLGLYRQIRTSHAQSLTGEAFLSLGSNAVSGRDVTAEGGILALSDGVIENREALLRDFRLPQDASDSALILRAYRMWGADYPRRVKGTAATAVMDRAEDRLILTRDRMGFTPVYYAWRGRSTAFAGQPDLLLRAGVAGRQVDASGLLELFLMGSVPTAGRTPFKDIRMLEPGCTLIADERGVRVKRYFTLSPAPFPFENADVVPSKADLYESAAIFLREQLQSALPGLNDPSPAALVSGRFPSFALAAMAGRKSAHPPIRFRLSPNPPSVSPPNGGDSAAHSAHIVAPTAEERLDAISEACLALGFPGAGEKDASLLILLREAARTAPIALSAVGAGVLFPETVPPDTAFSAPADAQSDPSAFSWTYADGAADDVKPSPRARLNPGLFSPPPNAPKELSAFPWIYADDVTDYLKPSLRARLNPERYARDRLHEALDRLESRAPEGVDPDRYAVFGLYARCALPAAAARWSEIARASGISVRCPFLSPSLISAFWAAPGGMQTRAFLRCALKEQEPAYVEGAPFAEEMSEFRALRAHSTPEFGSPRLYADETRAPNPARAFAGDAPAPDNRASINRDFSRFVRESVLRIASDPSQPLFPLLNIDRAEDEAHSADCDEHALSRLIQINDWFVQNEAEVCPQ